MDEKPKICFDGDYKIRILDPTKAAHAEELNAECATFVDSKSHEIVSHVFTFALRNFIIQRKDKRTCRGARAACEAY